MRRCLPVLVLATACIPEPTAFDEAYVEAWCAAFDEHCSSEVALDACRATGAPTTSIFPPSLGDDCGYRRFKAGTCLDVDNWTCAEDDDGVLAVPVPPEACAEVFVCE